MDNRNCLSSPFLFCITKNEFIAGEIAQETFLKQCFVLYDYDVEWHELESSEDRIGIFVNDFMARY